jgi:phosphatidylserine synthase 2
MELIVRHVDPTLKLMDYDEVSYAQDCRMVNHDSATPYASLYHACFDIFALAHFLGWFCKTLICRDLKLILFASASFEIVEYSLRDVLNNFKECWWDHVIIDFFGCNLLGIICAFFVIDKLGLDRYRWSLRDAPLQHSHWQNFKRFWTNWDVSGL